MYCKSVLNNCGRPCAGGGTFVCVFACAGADAGVCGGSWPRPQVCVRVWRLCCNGVDTQLHARGHRTARVKCDRPSPLANQCKCRGLLFFGSSVECNRARQQQRRPSPDCKSCKICRAFPTSVLDEPRVKPSLQPQRVLRSLHITRASGPRRHLQFLFRSPANEKHVDGGGGREGCAIVCAASCAQSLQ